MVVSALIKLRHVEPNIDIDVVALNFHVSVVIFFPGAAHNDEFVA